MKRGSNAKKSPEKRQCPHCRKWFGRYYLKIHIEKQHLNPEKKKKTINTKLDNVVTVRPDIYRIPKEQEVTDEELGELFEWVMLDDDVNVLTNGITNMKIEPGTKKTPKPKKKVLEQDVQKKLEKRLKCGHKYTPAGIIDIFNPKDNTITEIKCWQHWKHAIGQLVCYGYYHPNFMLKAHFFGEIPPEERKIVILTICAHNRIAVSWEK